MSFPSHKPYLEQVDPPRSPRETLPTMYDLPSENPEEPGLPDEFHDLQPQLLSRTLRLTHYTQEQYFTAADLNLYYDVNHPLWYKRPDWFLVVDVPRLYEGRELRRSYVTWQEGKNPFVAIEFLSPGTEREDLGRFWEEGQTLPKAPTPTAANGLESLSGIRKPEPPGKFEVYEQYLRIPHYLVYSRYSQRLRYFRLNGGRYEEAELTAERPIVWLADLDIGLGLWEGGFDGIPGVWLRWCDRQGQWYLTDTEQERSAKEMAQAQLLQAAQNLLATGMSVEQVAHLLNLSAEQIQLLQL